MAKGPRKFLRITSQEVMVKCQGCGGWFEWREMRCNGTKEVLYKGTLGRVYEIRLRCDSCDDDQRKANKGSRKKEIANGG